MYLSLYVYVATAPSVAQILAKNPTISQAL